MILWIIVKYSMWLWDLEHITNEFSIVCAVFGPVLDVFSIVAFVMYLIEKKGSKE